ncbi:hypothetical protein [Pseudactinotalea sp. Z1748]|uniref:hypothetical protein n=1 Tax=Pseudactinotalea sp. Z1748 TaxID=3413027 RepID=UPI003C7D9BEB
MSAAEIVLVALAVAALLALLLWSVAQRLDRLHRREFQTRATLEAQLVHRADTAAELASSGLLDPASSVLVADAALASMGAVRLVGEEETSGAGTAERGLIESDLSRTLRAALDAEGEGARPVPPQPGDEADLVGKMRQVQNRVQLARRFHNDAVVQIQQIRRLALVRIFRLPGHAPMPVTFEMDDARV